MTRIGPQRGCSVRGHESSRPTQIARDTSGRIDTIRVVALQPEAQVATAEEDLLSHGCICCGYMHTRRRARTRDENDDSRLRSEETEEALRVTDTLMIQSCSMEAIRTILHTTRDRQSGGCATRPVYKYIGDGKRKEQEYVGAELSAIVRTGFRLQIDTCNGTRYAGVWI